MVYPRRLNCVYRSLDFKPGLGKLLILLDQVELMFCSLLGNRLVREAAAIPT